MMLAAAKSLGKKKGKQVAIWDMQSAVAAYVEDISEVGYQRLDYAEFLIFCVGVLGLVVIVAGLLYLLYKLLRPKKPGSGAPHAPSARPSGPRGKKDQEIQTDPWMPPQYAGFSVPELRALCSQKDLDQAGLKGALVKRLVEFEQQVSPPPGQTQRAELVRLAALLGIVPPRRP